MNRFSVEAYCKGSTMEELIPEIAYEVKHRDKKSRPVYKNLVKQAEALKEFEGATVELIFDALIQAMQDMAPPYFVFSPVEGGWEYKLDRESLEEVKAVDDTSQIEKGYRGEFIHVNDHGNTTLYYRNSRGKDKEIWAIV